MWQPMAEAKRKGNETEEAARPPFDIHDRTGLFADRCIRAAMQLPQNGVSWELARQLVRSAGSVGANLQESKGVLTAILKNTRARTARCNDKDGAHR